MTLRRFRVYVPDKDAWLSPNDCYLCSEVDPLLKEARELLTEMCSPWKGWCLQGDHAVRRAEKWLATTETKP